MLPSDFVATFLFFLGVIIGSFLNVLIYRFHTNRSVAGRSHCMSCGHTLSWFELVPLFSYLIQGGRCRSCHSRITPRYALVEGLTGILFVIVAFSVTHPVLIALYAVMMAILVVIVVYDMLHTIIPDELVLVLGVIALCAAAFGGDAGSILPSVSVFLDALPRALLGTLFASGFFALLWVISGGRWIGLGDAKLAIPLGFMVSWPDAISLVVLAFWIGAVVSVAILLTKRALALPPFQAFLRGKLGLSIGGSPLTMKSEVPFAPFLIASFILVLLFGADIFALTAAVIPRF